MTTNVAIIGLGIMGTRMLQHMRKHQEFNPNYLWDPNPIACEKARKQDSETKIMKNADLKLFFTCSAKEKAKRRFREFQALNKKITFQL